MVSLCSPLKLILGNIFCRGTKPLFYMAQLLVLLAACEVPSTPVNGSLIVSNDGMAVIYSCDVGYSLVGDSEAICDQTGAGWSTTTPSCGTYCVVKLSIISEFTHWSLTLSQTTNVELLQTERVCARGQFRI